MRMSGQLLAIVGNVVQLPFAIFGIQNFFLADQVAASATPERITAANLLVRGKLDMLLVFLSGFVLPMLYGLLGACAFVLRQLSDEIDKLTYAHDARVRYSLRLNIGLLSGLAVGWFIKPGSGDATLISLSPLALAFIAGYGSDLFFVALDKVVQAFSPASGAGSKTVKEVVTGGIVTTSTRSEEVHVAGPDKDAAKTQQEDGKGHPVADKRVTEPTAESKSKAA